MVKEEHEEDGAFGIPANLFAGFNVPGALHEDWRYRHGQLEDLRKLIRKLRSAGNHRQDEWLRITRSCLKWEMTPTQVAFCGATGSGKSLTISALLGASVVPTHSHEACTSVPVRISYHSRDEIEATVHFMSYADFKVEVETTLSDLLDEEGRFDPDSRSPETSSAWAKLKAVYPRLASMRPAEISALTVDTLLHSDPSVVKFLDEKVKKFHAEDITIFANQVHRYLAPQPTGPTSETVRRALWPLVHKVDICYKSSILSTGLTLVDLPGGGDSNQARTRVAEKYMDQCDHLLIVSTSVRPGSEAISRDLMNKAFRTRLQCGRYTPDFLACLVTKSDDISTDEIIHSLDLSQNVDMMEIEQNISESSQHVDSARREVDATKRKVEECTRKMTEQRRARLSLRQASTGDNLKRRSDNILRSHAGAKRTRIGREVSTTNRTTPSEDPESSTEILIDELESLLDAQGTAEQRLRHWEEFLHNAQKARVLLCTKKRDEHTRSILIRNFREELQDATDAAMDQLNLLADDIDMDASSKDPSIFSVSARDYCRIKGFTSGDPPSTFSEEVDTGIPALRTFLTRLARPKYQASLKHLKDILNNLTTSLAQYIESDETYGYHIDLKKAMTIRWDSAYHIRTVKLELTQHTRFEDLLAPRLKTVLIAVLEHRVADWKILFAKQLTASVSKASKMAAQESPQIIRDAMSNMRWQTLNAILRRDGRYKHYNLNETLSRPFVRRILKSWQSVFKTRMFERLKKDALEVINIVLEDVQRDDPATQAILPETREQVEASKDAARDSLGRMLRSVNDVLKSSQMELSREIIPYIQTVMTPAYQAALAETGRGSLARRREAIESFVGDLSQKLYTGLTDVLVEGLNKTLSQIEKLLTGRLEQLAEEIENKVTAAWQSPRDNPEERATELKIKTIIASLKEFADSLPVAELDGGDEDMRG